MTLDIRTKKKKTLDIVMSIFYLLYIYRVISIENKGSFFNWTNFLQQKLKDKSEKRFSFHQNRKVWYFPTEIVNDINPKGYRPTLINLRKIPQNTKGLSMFIWIAIKCPYLIHRICYAMRIRIHTKICKKLQKKKKKNMPTLLNLSNISMGSVNFHFIDHNNTNLSYHS